MCGRRPKPCHRTTEKMKVWRKCLELAHRHGIGPTKSMHGPCAGAFDPTVWLWTRIQRVNRR